MKYVFCDTLHNQYIGDARDISKALALFEDTLNVLDKDNIICLVFDDNADVDSDKPDLTLTGDQFLSRAKYLGALPETITKTTKSDDDIKPLSQDRAGILKNLSIEEQAYVIGRVADQMLLDELDRRMNSYNSTLDKILGNIKGLEVRI